MFVLQASIAEILLLLDRYQRPGGPTGVIGDCQRLVLEWTRQELFPDPVRTRSVFTFLCD